MEDFMPIEELATILSQMYDNAPDGEKAAMIHLFGIRYARIIRDNNFVAADIIRNTILNDGTQMRESYITEINKGIKLARHVIDRAGLLDYVNEH
jgi:hypothetical protein